MLHLFHDFLVAIRSPDNYINKYNILFKSLCYNLLKREKKKEHEEKQIERNKKSVCLGIKKQGRK